MNIIWNQLFAPEAGPILFDREEMQKAHAFHMNLPGYRPTPLYNVPLLARKFGVGAIYIKDESSRFGLQSFKALGASWAIGKTFMPGKKQIFATATDGNHGRAVAWAAGCMGRAAIIHMPAGCAISRVKAIRDLGAECIVTEYNYDETVARLHRFATENGWTVIQDTAFEGYEEIPLWIMQGYGTLVIEICEQLASQSLDLPTHVFLQAGVGSFAASMISAIRVQMDRLPVFIIVEPENAACIQKSIRKGELDKVQGSLHTIMAGLACGIPSTLAWPVLKKYASASIAVSDDIAIEGVKRLYHDAGIAAGESGAATAGACISLAESGAYEEWRKRLLLDSSSRILLINTEGVTDPVSWLGITGKKPDAACRQDF